MSSSSSSSSSSGITSEATPEDDLLGREDVRDPFNFSFDCFTPAPLGFPLLTALLLVLPIDAVRATLLPISPLSPETLDAAEDRFRPDEPGDELCRVPFRGVEECTDPTSDDMMLTLSSSSLAANSLLSLSAKRFSAKDVFGDDLDAFVGGAASGREDGYSARLSVSTREETLRKTRTHH
jgi:hypothetical protein